MPDLDVSHVSWCRQIVDRLNDGGIWGIPRSGLIFQKTGPDELTLTARMPWMPEMEDTITPEQLLEQQQSDVDGTTEHMLVAGVTVIDGTLCPTCGGSGEMGRRGESVNPSSGMLVPDPQMDETGPCPTCHGTGGR